MRRFAFLLTLLVCIYAVSAQHLYPEHYPIKVSSFVLDDGRLGVKPLPDAWERMSKAFNANELKQANGVIIVQILVDSTGHAQLLSADNKTNVSSDKLELQKAVNSTLWMPAESRETEFQSQTRELVSVSYQLTFSDGTFYGEEVSPFETFSNPPEPITDGSDPKDLSYTFRLYTTSNGRLPSKVSRMSRGVTVDSTGTVWMGTDNGLVSLSGNKKTLYTYSNSPLTSPLYDSTQTFPIFELLTDKDNAVWIIQGWNVFRIKDGEWTRFDTLNSPVYWGRNLFVDRFNNVWITSWDGICKYDGVKWTVMDSLNSGIPTNKVLSFYVDKQDRQWVGTFSGNAMFDGQKWTDYRSSNTPLGKNNIDCAYQDDEGNMWFYFYAYKESKGGLYKLDTQGKWHHYAPNWTKVLETEASNDMLYDEYRNQIWISVNNIGLFMYDVAKDRWEAYTTENSNLPSGYIMQLTQDKEHRIWGATFNGFIQIVDKP